MVITKSDAEVKTFSPDFVNGSLVNVCNGPLNSSREKLERMLTWSQWWITKCYGMIVMIVMAGCAHYKVFNKWFWLRTWATITSVPIAIAIAIASHLVKSKVNPRIFSPDSMSRSLVSGRCIGALRGLQRNGSLVVYQWLISSLLMGSLVSLLMGSLVNVFKVYYKVNYWWWKRFRQTVLRSVSNGSLVNVLMFISKCWTRECDESGENILEFQAADYKGITKCSDGQLVNVFAKVIALDCSNC